MAVTLELIKKITVQGSAPGVDAATASLIKLAAAQGRLAVTSDQDAKRVLSSADAYRRQTMAVDETARSHDRIEKATRTADAALQQGLITQSEHAKRLDLIKQKYGEAANGASAFGSAIGSVRETLGAFGLALSIGALVSFSKNLFESVAGLENQAKTLGISTDALQAYHAAAVLSGAGADAGDTAIRRFTRSIGNANEGNTALQKSFTELLGVTQTMTGGTEAWLPKVATALLSIADATKRAAFETAFFGRAGQDTEAMLRRWADPEIIAHMKEQNLVLGEDLVKRLHAADVALETFWSHVKINIVEATDYMFGFLGKLDQVATVAGRLNVDPRKRANEVVSGPVRTEGIPLASARNPKGTPWENEEFKAAQKHAEEYLVTLHKQTAEMNLGVVAAKEVEIQLEAMRAPTDALREKILLLGDAMLFALGNKQVNAQTDATIAQLDKLIEKGKEAKTVWVSDVENIFMGPVDNRNKLPEILSIKTGLAQGKGDGPPPIHDDTEKFSIEQANAYLQVLERVNQQTHTAAASMAAAFGTVGKAVGDLSVVMSDYAVQQQAIEAKRLADGKVFGDQKKADAIASKKSAELEIQYTGDMLGAAKGFFNEKSAIYKGLQAAEMVYRAIQMAGAIQSILIGTTETTAAVTNAGVQATAWGVTAEAHTAASVPFPYNLAAMAAVAAALVAVGVTLGNSGGAGAGPGATDAVDRQKAAGIGSVLGDPTAKSASISKALELAQKNADSQLEYSSQMVSSLKSIESNIGSLTNLIARNLGVSGGSFDTSSLGLGSTHSSFNPPLIMESLLSSALGMSLTTTNTTKSLQDFGLKFSDQTLGSIAKGILGNVYQQVLTSSSTNFLGIKVSSSKSNSTVNSALGSDLSNQITKVVDSLKTGILSAATALGVTGASATLDSFKVALGTLSFKDLTGAQIQDQLNAVFGKLGDQLATQLIPALTDFQNAGEGSFETLVRLAREYQVVDVTMASIGKTFDAVGLASLAARDNLIQMAGGLDAFKSQAKFFMENFLTPAQQLSPIINAVAMEMARLGEGSVKTKDQFAALVLGLDVSTDAGAKLYSSLMAVAPAFAHVADAVKSAIDSAVSAIDSLISTSKSSADAYRQASKTIADTLNQLRSGTAGLKNNLATSRANFATGVAGARTGDLTALNALPKLAQDFATASLANSATVDAYRRDLIGIMGDLAAAGATANQQASLYDLQTGILEATKANLSQTQINTDLLQQQLAAISQVGNLLTAGTDQQLAAMSNGTLQQLAALGQVGGVMGAGNGAVVTQLQLLIQLQAQLSAAAAAATSAAAAAPIAATVAASQAATIAPVALTGTQLAMQLGPIDQLYKGHNTKLMDIQQALIAGKTITTAQWAQAGLPPGGNLHYYASGGEFGSGWAKVGEQGPELVNFRGGGRVYSNAQSRALVDNSGLVLEMRALRTKMQQMDESAHQTMLNTRWLEAFFRRVSPDGDHLSVKVVP